MTNFGLSIVSRNFGFLFLGDTWALELLANYLDENLLSPEPITYGYFELCFGNYFYYWKLESRADVELGLLNFCFDFIMA